MEKEQLKQAILSAISTEVEQWAEESQQIKDGYEYEDRFLVRMRNIGKIIMEKSVGRVSKDRNQKKTSHLHRGVGSKQETSISSD